jgi:hypothetical protein
MQCPRCQHDNPAGVKFCGQCGARIESLCPACHLGLGKLYRRTSKPEQAREHLTTATTMYREMGMGFWLEQAEAARRDGRRRGGREPVRVRGVPLAPERGPVGLDSRCRAG